MTGPTGIIGQTGSDGLTLNQRVEKYGDFIGSSQ